MNHKNLPIGISDFRILIEENYYFIDKSLFIKEVIQGAKVILLPRPRRFGKTLNLSMLRYYFDREVKEQRQLFDGCAILEETELNAEHMGNTR